ncbi:MAG: hypothetical protein ISR44_03515 [Rhodospirillales bacterium]|nr:hypothetical protein [Rhodospirillales bacterium]
MSIKGRLLAVLGLILIVYSAAGFVTLVNLNEEIPKLREVERGSAEQLDQLYDDIIPLMLVIKNIKMDVFRVQHSLTDISATRGLDAMDGGFGEAEANADNFGFDVQQARLHAENLDLPDVMAALDTAEKAFPAYFEAGVRMAKAYVAEGPSGGNKLMGAFDEVAVSMGESMDALVSAVEILAPVKISGMVREVKGIERDLTDLLNIYIVLSVIGFVVLLGGAVYLYTLIRSSMTYLLSDIDNLAQREFDSPMVTDVARSDEFGKVARAIEGTKTELKEAEQRDAESKAAKEKARREAHANRLRMARIFEGNVGSVVETVSKSANQVHIVADRVASTAENTTAQAGVVYSAADQASTNVETVASATEQVSCSIFEISRQVTQSTEIAGAAVREVEGTNEKVMDLADAAEKIGEVVALISDIADQTNLLALNATIEAARAGDAGKGFAVVASEVKNLANQTAKATEEISSQITNIQGATGDAVNAIRAIGGTINQISEITTTIAAAVEEQGSATQEIARNVELASNGTGQVTSCIVQVTEAAEETGNSANEILESAGAMSRQSEKLKTEVEKFLHTIREG